MPGAEASRVGPGCEATGFQRDLPRCVALRRLSWAGGRRGAGREAAPEASLRPGEPRSSAGAVGGGAKSEPSPRVLTGGPLPPALSGMIPERKGAPCMEAGNQEEGGREGLRMPNPGGGGRRAAGSSPEARGGAGSACRETPRGFPGFQDFAALCDPVGRGPPVGAAPHSRPAGWNASLRLVRCGRSAVPFCSVRTGQLVCQNPGAWRGPQRFHLVPDHGPPAPEKATAVGTLHGGSDVTSA